MTTEKWVIINRIEKDVADWYYSDDGVTAHGRGSWYTNLEKATIYDSKTEAEEAAFALASEELLFVGCLLVERFPEGNVHAKTDSR